MKKKISVLSKTALGAVILGALSTNAYAQMDGIVTKNSNGEMVKYSYNQLVEALENSMSGAGVNTDILDKFKSEVIVGFHDTVNGYIDYEKVQSAFEDTMVNSVDNKATFDLNEFTEKKAKDSDKLEMPEEIIVRTVDTAGNAVDKKEKLNVNTNKKDNKQEVKEDNKQEVKEDNKQEVKEDNKQEVKISNKDFGELDKDYERDAEKLYQNEYENFKDQYEKFKSQNPWKDAVEREKLNANSKNDKSSDPWEVAAKEANMDPWEREIKKQRMSEDAKKGEQELINQYKQEIQEKDKQKANEVDAWNVYAINKQQQKAYEDAVVKEQEAVVESEKAYEDAVIKAVQEEKNTPAQGKEDKTEAKGKEDKQQQKAYEDAVVKEQEASLNKSKANLVNFSMKEEPSTDNVKEMVKALVDNAYIKVDVKKDKQKQNTFNITLSTDNASVKKEIEVTNSSKK